RQKAIERLRSGGGSQGQVAQSTQAIRAELIAQGWSDSEIEKFMAQLPQFKIGGLTQEGPAYLHDDEFVVRSAAVNKYGKNMFERLNSLTIPAPRSPTSDFLSNSIMEQKALSQLSFGNISITNNVSGAG